MSGRSGTDEVEAGSESGGQPDKLTLVEVPDGELTDEQIEAEFLKALSLLTGRTVKVSMTGQPARRS